MPPEDENFETPDIYLAAYLSEAGCEMKGRRIQGRRVFLIFSNVGGPIKGLREDYFSGRGKTVACKYAAAIKTMKELVSLDDR